MSLRSEFYVYGRIRMPAPWTDKDKRNTAPKHQPDTTSGLTPLGHTVGTRSRLAREWWRVPRNRRKSTPRPRTVQGNPAQLALCLLVPSTDLPPTHACSTNVPL